MKIASPKNLTQKLELFSALTSGQLVSLPEELQNEPYSRADNKKRPNIIPATRRKRQVRSEGTERVTQLLSSSS